MSSSNNVITQNGVKMNTTKGGSCNPATGGSGSGTISIDSNLKLYYDNNKNTLGIQLTDTGTSGAVYDTTYNRPFEQVLPISQEYVIPANRLLLLAEIVQNPEQVFVLMPTSNTSINLPSLLPNVRYQNTNLRFANMSSDYQVAFYYKGAPIIQMAFERVSLVWHTTDGINYGWRYVA